MSETDLPSRTSANNIQIAIIKAASLNLSRETLRLKMHDHKIMALPGVKQGYRYPAWQVTSDGQLAGIARAV